MPAISNDWLAPLSQEFCKPYYKKLYETVLAEYQRGPVFPPADDIFNAFHLTPLSDVKVVILGQDPYHNYNQAHGLCFSVRPEVEIPPSLVNIYKELQDDLGCYIPNNDKQEQPIVFLLWGRPAQMKKKLLTPNPNHLILEAPHPSPLSAYRGFFGCKHFSQTNAFLEAHGAAPIDWQIENIV